MNYGPDEVEPCRCTTQPCYCFGKLPVATPLEMHPRLSEQGEAEAQRVMDGFRDRMRKVASDTLDELYHDVGGYIESDSWCNFRNQFASAFRRLDRNFLGKYNLRDMAEAIAKEFPSEIAKLIDEHNVEKIAKLEDEIKYWQRTRSEYGGCP